MAFQRGPASETLRLWERHLESHTTPAENETSKILQVINSRLKLRHCLHWLGGCQFQSRMILLCCHGSILTQGGRLELISANSVHILRQHDARFSAITYAYNVMIHKRAEC